MPIDHMPTTKLCLAMLLGLAGAACDRPDEGAENPERTEAEAPSRLEQEAEETAQEAAAETEDAEEPAEAPLRASFPGVTKAIAVLMPTEGNEVEGTIEVEQTDDGLKIAGTIRGLEPGTEHGFHVHQLGDCSASDGTSAGGHFSPEGNPHGLPDAPRAERHAGDLGNVRADADGEASFDRAVAHLALVEGSTAILGRAFILHAEPDDGGQPTGNAGARLGCAPIAIAEESR